MEVIIDLQVSERVVGDFRGTQTTVAFSIYNYCKKKKKRT